MGYRELSRMEIVEVVRRWQLGESQRAIARGSGVARETVKKYLRIAEGLGLAANGPPPTEDQVVRLVHVGRVVSTPRAWATPRSSSAPNLIGLPAWSLIWLVSLTSLSVSAANAASLNTGQFW